MKRKFNRRKFITAASVTGMGLTLGLPPISRSTNSVSDRSAILGGPKVFTGKWPRWPIFDQIDKNELLVICKL